MTQEFLECPICGSNNFGKEFKVYEADCRFIQIPNLAQHLVRHQCDFCDTIFGTQQMLNLSMEKLTDAYERAYASGVEEGDSTDFQEMTFKMFNPIPSGIYINWGAGSAKIGGVLRQQGYNVVDYDPVLEKMYPGRYVDTDFVMANKFDGIMSNSVIEHLQNPIKELLIMKSILKPGACMIHSTDCYKYRIEWTKYHLFFFVGKSLNVLAEKIGIKYDLVDEYRAKFTSS